MILVSLFLAFLQIGIFSFGGGYAILPFIEEMVVESHKWISHSEMIDVVTLSQMTPGPISLNAATFVGTKISGLIGSLVATYGLILPQFILMLFLASLVFKDKEIVFMSRIIEGLKPGMVGLIFIAALGMIESSIFQDMAIRPENINTVALACFLVGGLMYAKKQPVVRIIGMGAILGILLNLIL